MKRSIAVSMAVAMLACGGGETAEETAPVEIEPTDTASVGAEAPLEEAPSTWEGEDLQVRLVGSIPWETELASGAYRRVEVRYDGAVDTLDGVAVETRPVVVGDSALHGFDWSDGGVERAFRWAPGSAVESVELPEDFLGFTAFGLAPDAAHLAYVGRAEESPEGEIRLKAVVRGWPGGGTAWESHGVAGYPSGGKNSTVEWLSADSVEIRIRLDDLETPGGSWLRAVGSPSTGFAADTVPGG